jgi:hypothetical protein
MIGDQYLLVAFDQETKLVPSLMIGKRTTQMTERFALDLASRVDHRVTFRLARTISRNDSEI